MELVAEVRPELHRYCARMTGNVFDGEDMVQETLAKAYFALSEMGETPPLRPWLFRIAHNTALDFLRRAEHQRTEPMAMVPERAEEEEQGADPALVEAALSAFVSLPPLQRSAIVLKDVLGHSLEETAATMGSSIPAIKGALSRARANLKVAGPVKQPSSADEQRNLRRYADLFNARDWDGLRALLAKEARLDLVTRWQRHGPETARYFTRYGEVTSTEALRAEVGFANGLPVIAIHRPRERPYFLRLRWENDRVVEIRDFLYVPYLVDEAHFTAD